MKCYLDDVAELDAEVARMRAKFPNIFTSPLPNQPDTDSQTLKGGGDSIPFVSQNTGD